MIAMSMSLSLQCARPDTEQKLEQLLERRPDLYQMEPEIIDNAGIVFGASNVPYRFDARTEADAVRRRVRYLLPAPPLEPAERPEFVASSVAAADQRQKGECE